MVVLQLRSKIPDDAAENFLGHRGKPRDFPIVVKGARVRVYKPNGDLLLAVIPKAISEAAKMAASAFIARAARAVSKNRGTYTGLSSDYVRADGARSNTVQTPPVRSSIHGFFDRSVRFPFCRQTVLASKHPEEWAEVSALVREVAKHFAEQAKTRFDAQMKRAKEAHPAYVIAGTPFTTLTVNGSVAGAYHRDSGDYKPGFGCLSVFRRGSYRGALLGFPAYGVAADLQDRDLILFDPHEIHGNTPFRAKGEPHVDFERTSIVYYLRDKITDCLSPAEELERAKGVRGALKKPADE